MYSQWKMRGITERVAHWNGVDHLPGSATTYQALRRWTPSARTRTTGHFWHLLDELARVHDSRVFLLPAFDRCDTDLRDSRLKHLCFHR